MSQRLHRVASHLVRCDSRPSARVVAGETETAAATETQRQRRPAREDARLQQLFGSHCYSEGPLFPSGGGRKYYGLELLPQLSPEQV